MSSIFFLKLSLSVTKWIHLNHGDDGLLSFFAKVFDSLHVGHHAKLVLEPQDWESYAKARKMDEVRQMLSFCVHALICCHASRKLAKRLRKNAQGLKLRPDNFEDELIKIGFRKPMNLGPVGQGGTFYSRMDFEGST